MADNRKGPGLYGDRRNGHAPHDAHKRGQHDTARGVPGVFGRSSAEQLPDVTSVVIRFAIAGVALYFFVAGVVTLILRSVL